MVRGSCGTPAEAFSSIENSHHTREERIISVKVFGIDCGGVGVGVGIGVVVVAGDVGGSVGSFICVFGGAS